MLARGLERQAARHRDEQGRIHRRRYLAHGEVPAPEADVLLAVTRLELAGSQYRSQMNFWRRSQGSSFHRPYTLLTPSISAQSSPPSASSGCLPESQLV